MCVCGPVCPFSAVNGAGARCVVCRFVTSENGDTFLRGPCLTPSGTGLSEAGTQFLKFGGLSRPAPLQCILRVFLRLLYSKRILSILSLPVVTDLFYTHPIH